MSHERKRFFAVTCPISFFVLGLLLATVLPAQAAVEVVRDGVAQVSGIYIDAALEQGSVVRESADDLAEAIEAISGAPVEVIEVDDAAGVPEGPAIILGAPAEALGATPEASTMWKDTMRTVVRDDRVLVGGESDHAVSAGVMDLLHELGVRYFLPRTIPGDVGTVMPEQATVQWSERDHERHPHIRSRRVWGHNLPGTWSRQNMAQSEVVIQATHAWAGLIPEERRKPEHYAVLRYDDDGEPVRRIAGQFCVSNPDVAAQVAQTLIERFAADPDRVSHSISPNDGGGHCICEDCAALDVPGYKEPSSGNPVLSDRYVYFYNRVAEKVAEEFPDRYLAAYVYADYSREPRRFTEIHEMIVPVFAPIRYPRYHSMFNPISQERRRLRHEIEQYSQYVRNIGYYGYNFNLAETVVPFSRIDVWSRDLPWLAEQDLFYCDIETLANWNTHAPHIYLGTRYIYSGEEPEAIMDDFYNKLGGAAAEPIRQYWQRIDRAYVEADIHSGSFYGIEHVLTPEVLSELANHLDEAAALAVTERERGVVEFFRSGLRQGELTIAMINHLNSLDFLEARANRDQLHELNAELEENTTVSIYPNRYMSWFMDHVVDHAAAIIDAGGEIAVEFPNEWLFRLDYYDVGMEEHWFDPVHGNSRWLTARTWGAPSLYSQGFGDFKGPQWFKVELDVPEEGAEDMSIWFGSNDGRTRLWINSEPVPFALEQGDEVRAVYEWPRGWRAFSAPVGEFLKPGETNTFVVRIYHTLNDLNLGGILRPVMLYIPGPEELEDIEDTYQRMIM